MKIRDRIKNKFMERNDKFQESIGYIANYLIRLCENSDGNVIGISSSRECKEEKLDICRILNKEINKKGLNSKLIDSEREGIGISKNLEEVLTKERTKNDLIIVNIPSIPAYADGVEYAQKCDILLLLERYMYSTYKDYEETLIRLKAYGIKPDGVITYEM